MGRFRHQADEKKDVRGEGGRWKTWVLIGCMAIAVAIIVLATSAKIYATWALPKPTENWNATELSKVEQAYREEKSQFYDTGDPENMEGFTIAVFGDNHNSVQTFDLLISRIKSQNAAVEKDLKKLEGELSAAQRDNGRPPAERDKAVLALKKKINEVRKSKVLFAVDNGDLTISGNEVQYRMFFQEAKKFDIPLLTTPGNHDAKASSSDVYRRIFGPRYYSYSVGDSYFIMLDDANQQRIEPDQMKWFESELKKSEKYQYCLVFMHVPAFKGHRDMTDKGVTIPWSEYLHDRKNADEFKKLCARYEVSFVIGSHLHTFDLDIWDMSQDLDTDSAMKRNKEDDMVWTIITGGAGAQLWKTYDWRASYHYFTGKINGEFPVAGMTDTSIGISFDRITLKSKNGESAYFREKLWIYAFTDIVNNYLWEMLVLVPALIFLVSLVAIRRKRAKRPPECSPPPAEAL